jgi:hypothetical protein
LRPFLTSEAGIYMDGEAELEAKSGNVLDRVQHSVGILRGRGHQGYRVPASI